MDEDEEDGGGFGGADEEDEDEAGGFADVAAAESKVAAKEVKLGDLKLAGDTLFVKFGAKYFQHGNTVDYQIDPIKGTLLKVDDRLSKLACSVFVHICRWCGITARVGASNLTTMATAYRIIKPGINHPQLRDETFCQVMKQLTNNPSKASRARGVILITLMLGCYVPSNKLQPTLRKFIADGPHGFIAYNFLLLKRTLFNGTRQEPPCHLELHSAKRKQVRKVPVHYDRLNPHERVGVMLMPASTCSELVDEVCTKLGITNSYGFSIVVERHGMIKSLRGSGGTVNGHVMDVISEIDRKYLEANPSKRTEIDLNDVTGQLYLVKEFFHAKHISEHHTLAPEDCAKIGHSGQCKFPGDQGALYTYNQLRYQIRIGDFVCDKQEDYDFLMALMYYCTWGEEIDPKHLKDFLRDNLPEAAKQAVPAADRYARVEKLHAVSLFAKHSYSSLQCAEATFEFALEKWSHRNSFSSDGQLQLIKSKRRK